MWLGTVILMKGMLMASKTTWITIYLHYLAPSVVIKENGSGNTKIKPSCVYFFCQRHNWLWNTCSGFLDGI